MANPMILGTDADAGPGRRGRLTRALEHRVPPPLVMFVIGTAMATAMFGAAPAALPIGWRWGLAGGFFAVAGLFGFPALAAFGRAKTTIDPLRVDRASSLVTTGIYRFTRNPMYVAMALLLCAWAAWLARPWPLIGPIAFGLLINRLQIVPEERALIAKFGAIYADYCRSVRRWL